MVETLSGLPSGWINARLEELVSNPKTDLVDGPFGSNLKSSEYVDSGVPVLKIQNIKANRFVRKRLSYVTPEKASELSRHSFVAGDLMITKLGEPLGLCCKVPSDLEHGIFVADLMRLRPCDSVVDPTFLLHCINSDVVQSQFKEITKGTTRQRVNLTIVRSIEIQLPPMAEQRRIVAKIEELFSELDKGIESLKTAQAQLKVYRQALLKHAFEGKLTAQWRADNPDKLETAAALMERIQRERAQRYQQQLAEWDTGGKKETKPRTPKPLPPLTAEEIADLPELPEKWVWVRVGELVDRVTVGYVGPMKDEYIEAGIPFLRSQNVRENRFDPEGLKFVSPSFHHSLGKSALSAGDVVVVRSGSVGVSCVIPEHLGEANCSDLVIAKNPRHVSPHLLAYYMNWQTQGRVKQNMVGVALIHFNTKSVEGFAYPLCSEQEQQQMEKLLSEKLSEVDQLDQTLIASLKQSEALRQSILKKAFSGQLVPQDPTDEPAAALLARIKTEQSATPKAKKARK